MTCRNACSQGFKIYIDTVFPERVLARRCKEKATLYPKTTMVIEVIASVILGTLKIITLPLTTFSSLGWLPFSCLIKSISTRSCEHSLSYMVAWCVSLLASAIIVASVFGMVMISPEVVFFMIGVCGAIAASSTLLNLHNELFSLKSLPGLRS